LRETKKTSVSIRRCQQNQLGKRPKKEKRNRPAGTDRWSTEKRAAQDKTGPISPAVTVLCSEAEKRQKEITPANTTITRGGGKEKGQEYERGSVQFFPRSQKGQPSRKHRGAQHRMSSAWKKERWYAPQQNSPSAPEHRKEKTGKGRETSSETRGNKTIREDDSTKRAEPKAKKEVERFPSANNQEARGREEDKG